MNTWQQNFLRDLDQLKAQWRHRFDAVVDRALEPVFAEFEAFASQNGFRVTCPHVGDSARAFKFALEEDAYVLCCFRQVGVGRIEARAELFIPGTGNVVPGGQQANLGDATDSWFRRRFEEALSHFIGAFAPAGDRAAPSSSRDAPNAVQSPA